MRPRPPEVAAEPVPKLWPGSTVVCLGSGPSLCQADVDVCRERAVHVIAINNAWELAPWADVLYAADWQWWRRFSPPPKPDGSGNAVPPFRGLKYSIMPFGHQKAQQEYADIRILRNTGLEGLELDPTALRSGRNSGYQSINLAVHLGASQIVLLGYDMHGDHFFGSHPNNSRPPFKVCLELFQTLVEPLKAAGVSIVNCTPGSSLTCFPMAPLRSVLAEVAA